MDTASRSSQSTYRSFIRLLSLSKPYMGWYLLVILASLLSTVIGLGIIEATRRMITGAAEHSSALVYSGIYVGLAAITAQLTINVVIAWLKSVFYNQSTSRLQMKLLQAVSLKKISDLADYHSSDLYSRINDSAAEAQKGLNDKFLLFFTNIVQLGVAFAYFSWLNLTLTLGMIGFALAFPVITYPLTGLLKRQHDQRNTEAARGDSFLQDAIQGGQSVRALSLRTLFLHKYTQKLNRIRVRDLMISVYDGMFDYANRAFMFGSMMFILGFGGYQTLQGNLTIGGLTAFLVASGKLTRPIQSISGIWNELIASIAHTSRFQHFLDAEESVVQSCHRRKDEVSEISLQLSQVSYAYKGSRPVLDDINVTIPQGALTVIVGRSGSGKSTLLKLLSKLIEPTSGKMYCNNSEISSAWHSQLALVSQEPILFTGTIRDNIRFGREDASQDEIEQAARLACIHDNIKSRLLSYDTRIGENEAKLSGGEMQRLALARAYVRNPSLLLLDEPTASLDLVNEALVMESLHQYRQGKTVVCITHRLSLARQADQIIVLENGKIAESGSYTQLMNRRGFYFKWVNEREGEEGERR
ncbi:ABC transporter ATP-binding protein [Paenibacillus gorillae]|uniref:ABC transporter ATP-binding protein n=1 Tax=Paenibacillus gorillae TaxID=1243662 RepID=UPI0004B205BD|nr:ABC transporter ATP-binding protein [Paenibacillus gorillae]